jgi:hypothetical protein
MHAYIVCTYRSRKGDVHAQVDAPSKCDIGQASSSRYMDVNVLLVLFNNCIHTYMYILYREPALDWADTLVFQPDSQLALPQQLKLVFLPGVPELKLWIL